MNYSKHLSVWNLKKITRIYDYIWYGEFQINSEAFNQIKMEFEILNSKIAIQ
jgi:hypothetical protein